MIQPLSTWGFSLDFILAYNLGRRLLSPASTIRFVCAPFYLDFNAALEDVRQNHFTNLQIKSLPNLSGQGQGFLNNKGEIMRDKIIALIGGFAGVALMYFLVIAIYVIFGG